MPMVLWQRGPNKLPFPALCAVAGVSLLFIFIGDVNSLGPVVAMPFMLTYAAIDYAYFVLAMSFDYRRKRQSNYLHDGVEGEVNYGAFGAGGAVGSTSELFGRNRTNGENGGQSAVEKDITEVSESTRMVDDRDNPSSVNGGKNYWKIYNTS